jgi:hypothetical protein
MTADDRAMRLLEEFAAARARGERPDVIAYLERAGGDAERFGRLVEALWDTSPPPEPSAGSVAVMRALAEDEPPLLVLRRRLGMTLDEMAAALGDLLARPAAETPRLRALYQRLEVGRIDLAEAAPSVHAAVARVLGVDEGELPPAGGAAAGPVFARAGDGIQQHALLEGLPPDDLPGPASPELDRLFGLPG